VIQSAIEGPLQIWGFSNDPSELNNGEFDTYFCTLVTASNYTGGCGYNRIRGSLATKSPENRAFLSVGHLALAGICASDGRARQSQPTAEGTIHSVLDFAACQRRLVLDGRAPHPADFLYRPSLPDHKKGASSARRCLSSRDCPICDCLRVSPLGRDCLR
jgi:hypothetical protein